MPVPQHPVTDDAGPAAVIPVVAERLEIGTREQPGAEVRVRIEVDERVQTVQANHVVHTVAIRRVPRGEPVAAARAPWNEGDTLVVPVYEERVVLERRLVLKEEIHIERRTVRQPVQRQMPVRSERAVVERRESGGDWQPVDDGLQTDPPAEHRDNTDPGLNAQRDRGDER